MYGPHNCWPPSSSWWLNCIYHACVPSLIVLYCRPQVRYTYADGYLAAVASGPQNYTFREVDDVVSECMAVAWRHGACAHPLHLPYLIGRRLTFFPHSCTHRPRRRGSSWRPA